MSVNVNREISDDFYRYKMPKLIAKVEGKGNGIKTVIVNMPEVAKALGRPPIYPTKFFGAELGAQIQFDQKNERFIVNGAHDCEKLQNILDGFIRKYVLCSKCDNPETDLIVRSRGKQADLLAKCKACGCLAPVGDNGRTAQFIVKNPPDETGLALAASNAAGGKSKSRKKRGDKAANGAADRSPENGNSGDENAAGGNNDDDNGDADEGDGDEFGSDGEWEGGDADDDALGGETTSAAVAPGGAAAENLPASIQRLIVTDEMLELTPQDRADRFHRYLTECLSAGKLNPSDLVLEAERLDIRDKAVLVVVEVLLGSPTTLITDITKTYRPVFLAFVGGDNNHRAQKYLMGAVETLIARFRDALLDPKRIPNLLNAFYSADLLSEETLIEWDTKGPSKRHTGDRKLSRSIHDLAQPFINWLKTADVESDSEDDDNAAAAAPPSAAAKKGQPAAAAAAKPTADPTGAKPNGVNGGGADKPQKPTGAGASPDAGEDSDLDIDNI